MKINTIIISFIYFILISNFHTLIYYALFFLLSVFFVIRIFYRNHKWTWYSFDLCDVVPVLFVLTWMYGMFVGVMNNNKTEFLVRNFAGMNLYLFYYYMLYFDIKKEKVSRALYIAGLVNVFIAACLYIGAIYNFDLTYFGVIYGMSGTGQARIYYTNLSNVFTVLSVALMYKFNENKEKERPLINKMNILLIISSACLVFITASKGYVLGFVINVFTILFYFFIVGIYKMQIKKSMISLFAFFVFFAILLSYTKYMDIVLLMFSDLDKGNAVRYIQLEYLLEDFSFFGRGLGAVITGYQRNDYAYGFELSFINVIHKFGVMSILIFMGYLVSFYRILKSFHRIHWKFSAVALGAISFVWPAIGNPILFAPSSVLLHCCALYLIREHEEKSSTEINSNKFFCLDK